MWKKEVYYEGDRIVREIHVHYGASETFVTYDSDNELTDYTPREKRYKLLRKWKPGDDDLVL